MTGWEKQPEARVTQQLEEITMHFDLSEPEDSEVTAPTASGTDEGSNEDIAADAEVKDLEQQQQEASKTPNDEEPAYCFYAPIQPPSMDHALAGPQRGKWLVSRDAEYNSQMENHTWDLVYLPNGKKAIQCKWLAKIKTDEKGEPSVYKSRLVAKGFQQKEKEDYKEVFAPTANSPTLRVLLAVAAVRKWKVKQMDIVTAFLYGIVEEESLFLMGEGESLVLLLVYVDDILLFSSSDKEIDGVQRKLTEQFKCKSLGEARYYLGMHIERDTERGWLKLHQGQYIHTLAENAKGSAYKPGVTA
ncbi:hypothetical protein CLOM_g16239 [Closterium sp. NIES-68]|nr:hypothetical protein CLOM_g16239 [Closterium sp. NIES-68]